MDNAQRTNYRGKSRTQTIFLYSLFFILCSLSCELFNNPADPHFLGKLHDEVAWANADKLTVTVNFPPQWGSSPQLGTGRCFDNKRVNENPRLGNVFYVEFSPLPEFGFEKWLAFPTSAYAGLDTSMTAAQIEAENLHLNGQGIQQMPGVTITESISTTGARVATVTIHISEPVTLVPWCSDRPRLTQQTNPPISQVLTPFPFDQVVNIWFNKPVKQSTIVLGETITVSGIHASGNDRGKPFHVTEEDPDISGYFTIEFPTGYDNRVNLIPNSATAAKLALLTISVTVGPNIESSDGILMAAEETIKYSTDLSQTQKVYRPTMIEASRVVGSGYFSDAGTQWNNAGIDRRFSKHSPSKVSDIDTVYIRLQNIVPPEGASSPIPNKITVIERQGYTLSGSSNIQHFTIARDYDYAGINTEHISVTGTVYTITHKLQTTNSCIVQLLVLPWFNDTIEPYPMLDEDTALAEGQYVTIVIDNAAPNVDLLNAVLSTPSASVIDNKYIYRNDAVLELTLGGLVNIRDNFTGGGISTAQAWNYPWTMDDPHNLVWEAKIGTLSSGWEPVYIIDEETQLPLGINNKWENIDFSDLVEDTDHHVSVRFRDRMGNVSDWKSAELIVVRSNAALNSVTNLNAKVNETGDKITVTWDEPKDGETILPYLYPEIVIRRYRTSTTGDIYEGIDRYYLSKGDVSYDITTTVINDRDVRDGIAVSGVIGYEITVITHNAAGTVTTPPVWVYNIPNMDANAANTARITTNAITSDDLSKTNIVLTRDIALSNHTPIANFSGKFYGNGHTITINSLTNVAYSGIFGNVENAEIRDLTVNYAVDVNVGTATGTLVARGNNNSTGTRTGKAVGGLAGIVRGDSVISNIIVTGDGILSVILTVNAAIYSGTIIGFMDDTVLIRNCYTDAKLETAIQSQTNTNAGIWTGGIVGYINGPSQVFNDYMIQDVTVAANIIADAGAGSRLYIGGVAGNCAGRGKIENAEVSATLTMFANNTTTESQNDDGDNANVFAGGGIIGRMRAGSIYNSNFTGEILTTDAGGEKEFRARQETNIGGIVGRMWGGILTNVEIKNSNVSGNIKFTNYGLGNIVIGGMASVASSGFPMIFDNCEFQGSITSIRNNISPATGVGRGHMVGGFMGAIEGNLTVKNCRSNTGEINVVVDGADQRVQIGGFTGFFTGILNSSYTTTNINVTITPSFIGTAAIGGFAGLVYRNGNLFDCYATGDVTVNSQALDTGDQRLEVGGFIGRIDVEFPDQSSVVSRCFSLGSVKASALDKTPLYVGGFLGRRENVRGNIETSVALGQKVTMKGGNPAARGIGRVSGSGDAVNCYAVSTLELWRADWLIDNGTIIGLDETENVTSTEVTLSQGAASRNGTAVIIQDLFSPIWWQFTSSLKFNSVYGGLGNNTHTWDFSQISNYGYPFLMGIDGQGRKRTREQ